jgi:hypothetical protein
MAGERGISALPRLKSQEERRDGFDNLAFCEFSAMLKVWCVLIQHQLRHGKALSQKKATIATSGR